MRNPLHNAAIAVLLSALPVTLSSPLRGQQHPNAHVSTCSGIQLAATYLPNSALRSGPAFRFAIHNGTDRAISLVMPAPTSAHWYAREGARWSWRASNGAGGSPVDAMNPLGRMFAFRVTSKDRTGPPNGQRSAEQHHERLVVPAHGFRNWDLRAADNPVLNFKPSCTRCNHPDDREFRVVFAYAVLPTLEEGPGGAAMLRCGLRTAPVGVPASYASLLPAGSTESKLSPPPGLKSLESDGLNTR